jgi:hypothetical protein
MSDTLTDIYDRIRKVRRPRRPARLLAAAGLVLAVSACADDGEPDPPQPVVVEWLRTDVRNISTVCLDGDRLYGNTSSGSIAVVPGGCPR